MQRDPADPSAHDRSWIAAESTLGEQFGALAAAIPDRIAIRDDSRAVTFHDLERRTNRMARLLQRNGVGPGDYVSISMPNQAAYLEAGIAAWKIGAVPQPLSHRLPPTERDAILDLVQPRVLISDTPEAQHAAVRTIPGNARSAQLDAFDDAPLPPTTPPSLKAPTSGGSTGRPKIIVSTAPATPATLLAASEWMAMRPGRIHLTPAPFYHNAPFYTSMCALVLGCTVVVMPRFDPVECLRLIEEHRANWMAAVPTMMHRISRLPQAIRDSYDISSLEVLYHFGAPCPAALKRFWIEWIGPDRVLELYGATEQQALSLITGNEWLAHPGSVGRAVTGEFSVRDVDGTPLPAGDLGELWMRSDDPQNPPYFYIGADARRTQDGWESVGDLGSMDADGYLYLADRRTDLILVGGVNVYPAEVEAAAEAHVAVLSSCCIGVPDEDLGQVPVLFIETATGQVPETFDAFLRECLSRTKLPRQILASIDSLRDEAGKLRRSAVRDRFLATAGSRLCPTEASDRG